MGKTETVEQIKIELALTKEIKEYEYWSHLTDAEKIEVLQYRTALVKMINDLTADTPADEDKAAVPFAAYSRPKRPSVFDRYL